MTALVPALLLNGVSGSAAHRLSGASRSRRARDPEAQSMNARCPSWSGLSRPSTSLLRWPSAVFKTWMLATRASMTNWHTPWP